MATATSSMMRRLGIVAFGWFCIAAIFSIQGYGMSLYRGAPQPWWPSFGYSLAIFSIWAVLTIPIVQAVSAIEARIASAPRRFLVYAAGLPLMAVLHVGLFALIFWPLYNDGGRIASRWAMGERMLLANLDTNTVLYGLLVGIAVAKTRRERRNHERDRAAGTRVVEDAVVMAESLILSERGRTRFIPLSTVDWIGAAGDYVEVRAGGDTHLLHESLASLGARLPAHEFIRIHRQSLVRMDRVASVSPLGRGDALVTLSDGTELRMSRRFRSNLAPLIRPQPRDDPTRRHSQSRPPI